MTYVSEVFDDAIHGRAPIHRMADKAGSASPYTLLLLQSISK
jgi:hypothetical protein